MIPPRWPAERLVVLVTALALALGASTALGQPSLTLGACASPRGFDCGTLTVPLDRANPAGGNLTLAVRRLPARGTYRGTVVFLSGGPGQASITPGGELEEALRDAGPGYEVVAVDTRGTGNTALRCPTFERATRVGDDPLSVANLIGTCATDIGTTRVDYTSADVVADLEDLRVGLGRERLTLFGVSYGTLVATWYARNYPARVAGLILDSVVPLGGNTTPDRDSYAAARRALAELCRGSRCRQVTPDVQGDISRLEARLATRGITGIGVDRRGRQFRTTFGGPAEPTALFEAFGGGDLVSGARGAFPAAVKLALRGDPALLLRITQAGESADRPEEFSFGLFLATACQESQLPWTAGQAAPERIASATAAFAAVDPAVTLPFARPGADAAQVSACAGWPESPRITPPAAPMPDVPALLLAGTQDIRTPLESARGVAATLPRATLVSAAGSGHSSISSRGDGCALLAIRRYLRGAQVGNPCSRSLLPRVAPLPPARFAELRPLAATGRRGRTMRAVFATLDDLTFGAEFATVSEDRFRFTGLRGGTATLDLGGSRIVIRLRNYSYVPGVRLTGVVTRGDDGRTARLAVAGRNAVAGRVRFDGRDVVATLGGREVRARRFR